MWCQMQVMSHGLETLVELGNKFLENILVIKNWFGWAFVVHQDSTEKQSILSRINSVWKKVIYMCFRDKAMLDKYGTIHKKPALSFNC